MKNLKRSFMAIIVAVIAIAFIYILSACNGEKNDNSGVDNGEDVAYYNVVLMINSSKAGACRGYGRFHAGENVTVEAITNAGYTFTGWYEGETKLGNSMRYSFIMPDKDVKITARWIKCPVRIVKNITNAGEVSDLTDSSTVVGKRLQLLRRQTPVILGWVGSRTTRKSATERV